MRYGKNKPPKLAAWILSHIIDPDEESSLQGDFEEEYTDVALHKGKIRANLWCWMQVFISFLAYLKTFFCWSVTMFTNNLKVAVRNLRRRKGFTLINISGLAVGMACCVLILLWVQDELSFDRFHQHHEDLFRVVQNVEGDWWTGNPWPLAPILKSEYPEVLKSTRFAQRSLLVTYKEKSHYETTGFIDPDFFEMFTFPFVSGNPENAFPSPQSLLITESLAKKYFGTADPVGQALKINSQADFIIAGILKDVPDNSHLEFAMLASVQLFGEETLSSWQLGTSSYIQVQKNTSLDQFREKISDTVMKHDKRTNQKVIVDIQPLTRIHLYSLSGGGNIIYVYIFSTIAIFILLLACINFMNLATAKASARAQEVGMRKVVGARRSHVIKQFFGESLLYTLIALIIAVVLVYLSLGAFNNLAQKHLSLNFNQSFSLIAGLIGISLFTGIVSGSYPALYLSAFHPVKVFRGTTASGSRKQMFRKILVVSQFTIATILLIGTMVMYRQLNFIRSKDLGFNRENVVSIAMNRAIQGNYNAFKTQIQQRPSILNVTSATSRPLRIGSRNPVYWEGGGPEDYVIFNFVATDYDYIDTLGMSIISGRNFSRELSTDTQNYIVNEEAVKIMGMQEPLGKMFSIWEDEGKIIGVVKNFHSQPMHKKIEPLVLTLSQNWAPSFIFIRIKPENTEQTLKSIEEAWRKFSPNYPFEYVFLDDYFERLYRTDQRTGAILKYFTILAIFISCLGILGLSAYLVEQRTKEIGVRKVLGASIQNLVLLLNKEFVILLTLANIIAWPIAYILMRRMLNNYAYRTDIAPWVFIFAAILAYVIALLTVSFQALKAARANPADSLRYE